MERSSLGEGAPSNGSQYGVKQLSRSDGEVLRWQLLSSPSNGSYSCALRHKISRWTIWPPPKEVKQYLLSFIGGLWRDIRLNGLGNWLGATWERR